MFKKQMQKKFEENQEIFVIGIGVSIALGTGFILGRKYQRELAKQAMKGVMTLSDEINPLFPLTMSIAEIKEAISAMDGAKFMDAIVVDINGVQRIMTR